MHGSFLRIFWTAMLCAVWGYISAQDAVTVISPAAGVWGNKQALVLDVPDGSEVFYSFSGSNPLESGFAYDGPVLLDVSGDVTLNIVAVGSGEIVSSSVSYTVKEAAVSEPAETFLSVPVYEYIPGDTLSLPEDMDYRLGYFPSSSAASKIPYLKGRRLSLDPANTLERFVPCTLRSDEGYFRFVIHVAAVPGSVKRADTVPFEVDGWSLIRFTDPGYIYSIDGGDWTGAGVDPFVLDRSVAHTISWQSIAYKKGNRIHTFELLPKPSPSLFMLKSDEVSNSAVFLAMPSSSEFDVSGYAFSFSDGSGSENIYSSLCADIFYGEEFGDVQRIAVFYKGVYQGTLDVSFSIDKCPPKLPDINPLEGKTFYSRSPLTLSVSAEKGADVFYEIQRYEQTEGFDDLRFDPLLLQGKPSGNFSRLASGSITLPADTRSAVLYTVFAYASDGAGNRSLPVSYSAIVDTCNYYVDASANTKEGIADGSMARPFSSFRDVLPIVNSQKFTRVYISGTVPLPETTIIISDCEINSRDGGVLSFTSDSPVEIRGARVKMAGCSVEQQVRSDDTYSKNMFKLNNAASVEFDSCNFAAVFGSNGTLLSSTDSAVSFRNCLVSVQSKIYVSMISGRNTDVSISESVVSLIAPTSVCFSLTGGKFSMNDTHAKVVARLGRIAELSSVSAGLAGNDLSIEFTSTFPAGTRSAAIWTNRVTDIFENKDNTVSGFQEFQDTL